MGVWDPILFSLIESKLPWSLGERSRLGEVGGRKKKKKKPTILDSTTVRLELSYKCFCLPKKRMEVIGDSQQKVLQEVVNVGDVAQ